MTELYRDSRSQKKGILLMAICASMWSIAGIFIKQIPWNPLAIAGWRSLLAGLVVLVYIRRKKIAIQINRHSILTGVSMMVTFLSFVTANKLTTAANAIVLQFTSPVFLLILSSLFLHQRFRKGDLAVVLVTLGGISLFFLDQLSPGGMAGNCFGILAGFALAIMYLVSGSCEEDSRMSGMLLGQLLTAVVGIPFFFGAQSPVTPGAIGSILVLGIIQLGIPYVLLALAVGKCPPLACCLIGALEPLLNPVWVFLFDGEAPGVFALIGGVVVIVAVTVWCVWDGKNRDGQELPTYECET